MYSGTTIGRRKWLGDYLGANIDVSPHITGEIKVRIRAVPDVLNCRSEVPPKDDVRSTTGESGKKGRRFIT